jgi:hypothetical protein
VNAIRAHQVQWVTAAPLWPAAHVDRTAMQRPAILRFTSDRFMDELLAELAAHPEGLGARLATASHPSYREPAPGEGATTTEHLKLYQPAHGHFYLVASSLVCRLPGLPDHAVDRGHDEQAGFVIRRLDAAGHELALVGDDAARSWQAAARGDALVSGEQVVPLFPVGLGEPGRRRRLFAGLVPVARQEELQSAPIDGAAPAAGSDDVLEDVKARVSHAIELLKQGDPPADAAAGAAMVETSRFVLLDLADFVHGHLPAVWTALSVGARPDGAQGTLVDHLHAWHVGAGVGPTLAAAAAIAWAEAQVIATGGGGSLTANLRDSDVDPTELQTRLAAALHEVAGEPPSPPSPTPVAGTFYVLRCVYRRQRCGPLKPDVLSAPSAPFTLAPFFDPDAPARPVRISLPIDPSIAGLRKFRKNVTFALSGALRQKMVQAGALKDDKLAPSSELDCPGLSFSIPIITICAMILLFLMIGLLNLVFWWLPFVKICIPRLEVE